MTSSQQYRAVQITNIKSLMAQSMPSSGFTVLTGGFQRLGERKKGPDREGRLEMCQGGPGEEPGHRGRYGNPPREKTTGITYPSAHTGDPAPDGPEGSGALGGEAPINVPRSARGIGSLNPHPTLSDPAGSGPGMAVASLSLRDRGLGAMTLQAAAKRTHLADIVRSKPNHLGFCGASGL